MKRLARLLFLLACVFPAASAFAQSGKIAGTVTDATTGEALPGVNISIEGTTQGATTDGDGYYTIINVTPGTYALRASFIGFAPQVVEDVRVNIDLTTEIDFQLQEETVGLDEMVVTAQRPVVQRDISANVANLNATEIENLPVASVTDVIGLQAGVEAGMSIRGSGMDQMAFMVDGLSMRDGRDNTPFTGVSFTAIDEVQVQTGGFNAEYGNVRSGLVNIVTKEGPRDRYIADVLVRYAPPSQKHFGGLPSDPDAYWIRPFLDPDVAFTGTTAGAWDPYTRRQYPDFKGWNRVSQELAKDDDPSNDLTPQEAQEVFLWRHRKNFEVTNPDYEVDASLGGPVPAIGKRLGNLRFLSSYRQTQNAYVVPQVREAYTDRTAQVKVTSDVARGMKLVLQGLYAKQLGINDNDEGWPSMFTGGMPVYPWDTRGNLLVNRLSGVDRSGLYANDVWVPMDITRSMFGATLTHTVSARTFYEASVQRMASDYFTRPGARRDTTTLKVIGNMRLDEAPFGWQYVGMNDVSGMRLGGHWGTSRDSSEVAVWTSRFDVTSQVNRYAQVKAGLEYLYSDYDTNHGMVDSFFVHHANPRFRWERQPVQGAAYGQAKLEFKGMVANLGLRLDYFHAGGDWYDYQLYDRAFSAKFGFAVLDEVLEKTPTERRFELSPRLGIAFPITDNSKFFFNYGHFRQMLNPSSIFAIRKINTGAVDQVGNPNAPMPRTVAYELGYEQNLFDQFLLRLGGYYKALDNQPRQVRYTSIDGQVNYTVVRPYNYEDIRGFEVTLSKNRGRWVRGFVNYTYMAVKRGNFGFAQYFENQVEQRQFVRESRAHYQQKPVPEPYARINLEVLVPKELGPSVLGTHPLGDWRISFLGQWRAGEVFTWSGPGGDIVGLQNNVRWKDYYNLDLRFAKSFGTRAGSAQFFVDLTNVLNLRHLHRGAGFEGPTDFRNYMQSLQLPESTFEGFGMPYPFVAGDDRPGDFRKNGVEFVPIEVVGTVDKDVKTPHPRPLYFEQSSGRYLQWDAGAKAWQDADPNRVKQVLDDKAYIDNPNESYHSFLNPRHVFFGLRLTFR